MNIQTIKRRVSTEELELRRVIRIAKMSKAQKKAYDLLIKLKEPVFVEQIIGPYICDFVCQTRLAVLEIDGYTHDGAEEYDGERDKYLLNCGFDVYRISIEDINETYMKQLLDRIPKTTKRMVDLCLEIAADRRKRGVI